MKLGSLAVVASGGFLKSYVQSLLAVALALMAVLPGVDATYLAWFSGIGAASQILSSLVSGFLAERFGLRRVLVAASLSVAGAALLFVSPGGTPVWMSANVAKGFCFGVVAALMPVVLSESGTKERTSRASGLFQLSQQIGGVVGAAVAALVVFLVPDDPALAFRVDFLTVAVPAAAFLLLVCRQEFLPALRTEPAQAEKAASRGWFFGRAVLFMVFMSACGVGTVGEYHVVLFVRRGLTMADGSALSAVFNVTCIAAVALSTALGGRMSDVRRVAVGTLGIAFALFGAVFAQGVLFALCVGLATAFFAFGPGSCAWGLVPRLIPSSRRAKCMSFAIVAGQLVSLALTSAFLPVMERLGLSFWLAAFGIISLVMTGFLFYLRKGGREEAE